MESNEHNQNSQSFISVSETMDKNILSFLTKVTAPWKDDHDLQVFYEILNGKRFENGKTLFKLKIGSGRRINPLVEKMKLLPFSYNEFIIDIRLTSRMFHLVIKLFHNAENTIEEFKHNIYPLIELGVPKLNQIFSQEEISQETQLFLNEILLLLKLNREIRVYSEMTNAD